MRKPPALSPVYQSRLMSVIPFISSFLLVLWDHCLGLHTRKGAEDAALFRRTLARYRALPPGGAITPTPPPGLLAPGVVVPIVAARGRLGLEFSGTEGARAAGRLEPAMMNQGGSSGITVIIINHNNSNSTGSSSNQLLPI